MSEPTIPTMPHTAPRLYGIAALVAFIVVSGLWLVTRFTAADLSRDLHAWEEKLNLVAESRATDVSRWVEGNIKELQTLAENPSMQLYMTELQMKKKMDPENEPAQMTYLRNLLLFTAERGGFGTGRDTPSIPADLPPESKSGLGIFDNKGKLIVSTPMEPATKDLLFNYASTSLKAPAGIIDIRKDGEGTPIIGFVVPVFSIQGDHTTSGQIGHIIGIKTVGDNLFGLLKYSGSTEKSLESILVRVTDNKVEYISPLSDGTGPLSKQSPLDPKVSAEAALIRIPGNFVMDAKDYRDYTVLATSRTITGTPWVLVTKINRHEALAQSEERRANMVVFFFLIITAIVLIIVAVWWQAHSRRSMMLSDHFREMAAKSAAQEKLLRLVTNHQPEPIYIIDDQKVFRFANQQAALDASMSEPSMPGKNLNDVWGYTRASSISQQCDKAREVGHIVYSVQNVQRRGEEKIVRSVYIPLEHIPVAGLPEPTPGVLVVEQDISNVVHERERRVEVQRQLVQMLVWMVDKRDPFAANHSHMVSQVAYAIAIGMGLDDVTIETAQTAANLLNIGKIVVPTELLTKTDSLTDDEKRIIHESMNAAAELVAGIRFDGPVAETLRQWQEKWDGSGILGIRGDKILITARIIAVANTFIGMISPRAWRNALTIEDANKFLLDQSGTLFDRRVVITLVNYVENQNGRAWLQALLGGQQKAA